MSDGHDERARGFAAFPAHRADRGRGRSWWSRAWAEAVEDGWPAGATPRKGQAVARSGRLGPLTVGPGHIAAQVYEEVDEPYTVALALPELDNEQWDALWERVADRPAQTAALLAGELPPDLLEAAEDARLGLLPGYGELDADCGCEAPDHPCAHAVALAWQFSWLLDEDPGLLLLVRGRGWGTALEELRSVLFLRALNEDEPADEDTAPSDAPTGEGTPPAEAYALPRVPLPDLPPLPAPVEDTAEPVTGIEADPLERLVADAAARAAGLLAYVLGTADAPPPPLDRWQDTVRIAATHPDPRVPARLRDACGRPDELDRAAEAWRWGGAEGLRVLEETWQPDASAVTRARTSLSTGWEDETLPAPVLSDNHWTLPARGLQLRYGRDARWYPYRDRSGTWWPAGPPTHDPALALAELLEG
ncbi:Uncharacterized conserved protein, contains Zn finger domain [Streptomyces sp. TverLS-915]|uniref:SWIM zinc finger family protein n=1 Tax=Streptomyces sp. TverLS-915 TaxID=1839763 RepID=UPI00081D55D5|nr:hypothetical protein [Streptomyces sp. TverLS-915]SCD87432.1 Uncharacterized conserved protein, contains Zn finger domain [Streptomyces sp. TverLS-915]